MLRGTFELPKFEDGKRYRIVVGGSAHVNAGESFSIHVNGKLLCESTAGVGKRQGRQPRGHLMVWVEEASIPLVGEVTTDGR